MRIGFNKPYLSGNELKYVNDAVARLHISGDGFYTKKCSHFLEQLLGAKRVLMTTSCSHALDMSALLLGVQPGDEVIVPSFTFVSTVNAFVLRGAKPVFIDIRSDTLNMDERLLPELVTTRTKAIVPVHYAGVACDMDEISAFAKRHDLAVIEDAAHGLFGAYRGKALGTIGQLGTFSFHETKNVSCGEGGALVINDEGYIERAEIIREKGTNRSQFFRGEVDKYRWVDIGSSYLPSDMLCAFLFAQLEAHESIQSKRSKVWTAYYEGLKSWGKQHAVKLPSVPDGASQAYHLFYLVMPTQVAQQRLIEHLRRRDIQAVFHYLPLHQSQMAEKTIGHVANCPVTDRVSSCLVRLPFFNDLSEAQQEQVIEAVTSFVP